MEDDPKTLFYLYRSLCEQRSISPDPNLLSELEECSILLHLTSEPHITLILHLLTTAPTSLKYFPQHLWIGTGYLPAETVGTLATYLSHQNNLISLSIENTSLPDTAVETLLTAISPKIAPRSSLTHLKLSNVGLTTNAALAVAPLLSSSLGNLKYLNLSNNAANFPGVRALMEANAARPPQISPLTLELSGNLVRIEMLNTITHGIGAVVAFIAGLWLTIKAHSSGHSNMIVASIAVYCVSLFTLLASSCAYHSFFRRPLIHALLRRADHCSIFLLIAGTYTPFIVAYTLDPPTIHGPVTLAAVWGCAITGVIRSLLGVGTNRTRALFALCTGWIGIFSVRTLKERMQSGAMYGVFIGGMAYSIGLIFYLLGKRIPILHVVWHFAVIIGGGFHYLTLSKYVVHSGG